MIGPGKSDEAPVPAPDYSNMSDEQLVRELSAGMVDSPSHKQAALTFQLRQLKRQTESSQALVNVTANLVRVTSRLATATWWLVGATVALLLAACLQAARMLGLI